MEEESDGKIDLEAINENKDIMKFLLKPLKKRPRKMIDNATLASAYERIDHRIQGLKQVRDLQEVIKELHEIIYAVSSNNINDVSKKVELAKALYQARLVSREEFVFFAVYPIENLHNDRVSKNRKLIEISEAIDKIRNQHGLGPDEDWIIGEGPPEYVQLNTEWENIYDRLFLETLREFDLSELTKLYQDAPEELDRLRERGRRIFFHRDELIFALKDIIIRCEEDAKEAATARAYLAAIVSLGAGLEGLLLMRCLRSKVKATRIAKKIVPRKKRPRFPDDHYTWTFDNLIQVCFKAGWLPTVTTTYAEYNSSGLANLLREMRNYIHPGRQAKEKPWSEVSKRDYDDAYAIYIVLLSKLAGIGPRKLKSISNKQSLNQIIN